MPFVQLDIDALDAAYKAGVERVHCADGRDVLYRSVAEYLLLRRMMVDDVAAGAGTPTVRRLQVATSRGLGW